MIKLVSYGRLVSLVGFVWRGASRSILREVPAVESVSGGLVRQFSPAYFQRLEFMMGKAKGGNYYYAVAKGRTIGIFPCWDDCKAQVDGYPNARYKKFPSPEEAEAFIEEQRMSAYKAALALPKSSAVSSTSSTATFTLGSNSKSGGGSAVQLAAAICNKPKAKLDSVPNTAQKRSFSKTALKVTEDKVVNKRAKLSSPNLSADLTKFTVDEEGYVVVFTDGACTKNGRQAAKAGIGVWFGNDHFLNVSEPVNGRQTNNTAEIQAAERAVVQAKKNGINKLQVKTDSQFTINCVTKWLNNWKRNNWRLSSGGDVKNKEDLIKLDEAMQNMEIKWSYVAGHAGIEGNEAADRLAVAGAERSKGNV